MRNKPNFPKAKMNLNLYMTMDYEKKCLCGDPQNKPKQTQSCPPMEGKGGNITPAWKTIAKVNSVTFAPGDSVLFETDQPWWVMENENTARFYINRHYGLSFCFFLYCPGERFS
jgi:hypothetical protein